MDMMELYSQLPRAEVSRYGVPGSRPTSSACTRTPPAPARLAVERATSSRVGPAGTLRAALWLVVQVGFMPKRVTSSE